MFGRGVRIGRIGGAEVRIGAGSVLFAILIASQATAGSGLGIGWAVALGLGFMISIVIHELGHLVGARMVGIGVREISLDLIGGQARLERPPRTGPAQMLVAAAGPAATLALSGASFVAAALLDGPAGRVARWMAAINLLLGLFNLLPGLPLDGGQIVTGFRWWRTGDRMRGVAAATLLGRILGYVLIGLGVLQFASGGGFGLWTALIGWVMISSAKGSVAAEKQLSGLRDVEVASIMSRSPALIDLEADVQAGFQRLWNAPPDAPGLVLVDEEGVARGFVSAGRVRAELDRDPRTSLVDIARPLDQDDVAFASENLADVLARGVGVPFVVIDEAWRPTGVVGAVAVAGPMTTATEPPPGPVGPPRHPDLG